MNTPEPAFDAHTPALPFAAQQDVVRASQRDRITVAQVARSLGETVRSVAPASVYVRLRGHLPLIASLAYYGLTTGRGRRTLGEEYTGILPVSVPERLPQLTLLRRVLLVLLLSSSARSIRTLVLSALAAVRVYATGQLSEVDRLANSPIYSRQSAGSVSNTKDALPQLEQDDQVTITARTSEKTVLHDGSDNPTTPKERPAPLTYTQRLIGHARRTVFINTISAADALEHITLRALDWAEFPLIPLHRAMFYLTGAFHDLSRHVVSQRFIFMRSLREGEITNTYSFLGILTFIQILTRAYIDYRAARDADGVEGGLSVETGAAESTKGKQDPSSSSTGANGNGIANGPEYKLDSQTLHEIKLNKIISDPTVDLPETLYMDGALEDDSGYGSAPSSNSHPLGFDGDVKSNLPPNTTGENKESPNSKLYLDRELTNDSYYQNTNDKENSDPSGNTARRFFKPRQDCMLCMSPMTYVTSTTCGHLFCWSCVAEWVSKNNDCPLCRQSVQLKELVRVVGL